MTDLERIRAEREAQGLAPQITDAAALARIAAVLARLLEAKK